MICRNLWRPSAGSVPAAVRPKHPATTAGERLERRNLDGQKPNRRCKRSTLKVEIGAKSRGRAPHETEIHAFALLQLLQLTRRQQRNQQAANGLRRHGRSGVDDQRTVHSECCRRARNQKDIRRMSLQPSAQEMVDRPPPLGFGDRDGAIEFIDESGKLILWRNHRRFQFYSGLENASERNQSCRADRTPRSRGSQRQVFSLLG